MSSSDRPLLMIPGPLEFEPAVLEAMGQIGTSHVAPDTIDKFGSCLEMLREVFLAEDGQPFILSASGSLGWDFFAVNFVEAGENVLVINTGYFGDSFANCCAAYGANVTQLGAPVGAQPSLAEIEAALSGETRFKMVTITHVDTSTGVLTDAKGIAETVRRLQPDALIAVDGVCSLAGEELRMQSWDIDMAMTGSQKALGVPPGLCLMVVRPRAMAVYEARTTPVASYYAALKHWLPIMKKYEAREPSYFATPAVSHVFALNASLRSILDEAKGGMDGFFARHRIASTAFRAATASMGLSQVPVSDADAGHTLSCLRYPEGVTGADLLPRLKKHGIIAAGGLHKDIKAEYFRVGHLGMQSTRTLDHVRIAAKAIALALNECGHEVDVDKALTALADHAVAEGYKPAP